MEVSFSVQQICAWIGGRVVNAEELGSSLETIRVRRPAALGAAQPSDLSFFFSRIYQHELMTSHAGVLVTGHAFAQPLAAAKLPLWKSTAVIACDDPYLAMAILSGKFAEHLSSIAHIFSQGPQGRPAGAPKIHPSAVVDPTAELGAGVEVDAHVVIAAGARVGAGSILYPGCFLGEGVTVGEHCVLFPNVVLYEWVSLGNRVRIHANTTLGADGFGYAPRLRPSQPDALPEGHEKIFHLGRVCIGDDVEIGANCTIDRGTIADTRIERGAKIDNNVHIGHNAFVDEGAIVCGNVALAGNAHLGKFTYIGGIAGITNHVHVGDGAKVGAMTLLTKDVPPGAVAVGNPQREQKEHFRVHAWLSRMSRKGKK